MSDSIVSYCNVTLSVVLGHDAWFLCLMTRVCRQWSRAMSDPLVWRRICIADPHQGMLVSHRSRMWQHLFDNTSDDGDICYMVTRPLHQPPLRHILSRARGGLRELYICAMLGESELLDVLPARAARHLQVLKMAGLRRSHSGPCGRATADAYIYTLMLITSKCTVLSTLDPRDCLLGLHCSPGVVSSCEWFSSSTSTSLVWARRLRDSWCLRRVPPRCKV